MGFLFLMRKHHDTINLHACNCTLFFCKNIFYKNVETEICEILRIF